MKHIYFLLFICLSSNLSAQIINFPDANFKAILLSASASNQIASTEIPDQYGTVNSYSVIDTNNNGEIEESEAAVITCLFVIDQNNFYNITDLTGIEKFTNLVYLKINNNFSLNTLNLSQNLNLLRLNCRNNQINNLDITQCQNLEILFCANNPLVNLDISQNLLLRSLDCENTQITSLNLNPFSNLLSVECSSNQLSSLDVTQNINLLNLYCDYNQLSTLDVTQNINLVTLTSDGNQLTSIDLSNNPYLEFLYLEANQLTSLDVSQNPVLNELKCSGNSNLSQLILKNGNSTWDYLEFACYNLEYICADEEDVLLVQQKLNEYGLNCNLNSYCSFVPGGDYFSIEGQTVYDYDNNGCDSNDLNYSNLRFSITDGTISGGLISNITGNYTIPVQPGNHTITPILENPTYFNISPTNITVDFPTQTSPFTQDFCVTANGVHSDVEVIVLPLVPTRPGFDADYKVVYRNKGNQIENGSVSLSFEDTILDYVTANPVFDSQATNSFTWNFTNLQPLETREIQIVFNVNSPVESPAVNIDDILNYTATITTANSDETPDDNGFTLHQTVVGSYDPNDKTCLEGASVGPDQIGKYVHYVIRFENMGSYAAENVVVKDMIDLSKFDIATLVPLKGSHDFYTRINGNKVEFVFENINLDFNDATNDGYVTFKIKTKSTLVLGDTFANDANIYFDYNFPITTNTYTTTIQALSSQDFDFGSQFILYPNPVKEVLYFNSKENLEIQSVEIYNLVGQIVIAIPNTANKIDVSSLGIGTYFVKVNTEKGSAVTKFIKE